MWNVTISGRAVIKFGMAVGAAVSIPPVLRWQTALAAAKTVRMVMGQLQIFDPIVTTANNASRHGPVIYDTLFALDSNLGPKPQMVGKWGVFDDSRDGSDPNDLPGANDETDGEVVVTEMSPTRIFDANKNAGKHFVIIWDAALVSESASVIPEGDSRLDDAYKFLVFVGSTWVQADIANETSSGPYTNDAKALVDPATLPYAANDPAMWLWPTLRYPTPASG
ncbi:hypothetical protein FDV58_40960 [Bradyrhizobium elkanii]|uniref:Uncharacterized protein n=1 Tax=Bradyrhizobium elkanii TaxID=29448 RepID=A0A4U6RBY7_BRAEL|nr:extracellular solute-binding protein [Bradyrhizobium elkanii]TKV70898.1 hypothetical protein FDV58_40960 [Bradyrhizobium elkanii]